MSRGVTFAEEGWGNDDNDGAFGFRNNPQPPASSGGQDGARKSQPSSSSGSLQCLNCGSTDIEQHEASGASVCVACGVLVEENAIVSSVEFTPGDGGASSVVGKFVSNTSSKAFTGGGGRCRDRYYGFSRDSRETTLANGRRRIQDVASRLRLGMHFVDAAHQFFTVAVERNFVQGRRTTHVVAACLYIACRQEKTQHMLIDFSDALQVNVYKLGTCFLKFRRLLGLRLDIIDPALYVYRFAAHLDLDDKANAVALTALRLVGRMRRDWIVAGRRPAGICAAALLIAARAHGFTRNNQDVTKILRVCGMTVTNRVKEFEHTPSAKLTLEQFNTIDLETEADPPVFTRNRIKEARVLAIQQNNAELLASGALDNPLSGKHGKRWRKHPRPLNERKQKFSELYNSLEAEMNQDAAESRVEKEAMAAEEETEGVKDFVEDKTINDATDGNVDISSRQIVPGGIVVAPSSLQFLHMYPRGNDGRALVLPNQATAEELQASTQPVEDRLNLSEWKEDMPVMASEEIEGLFRNDEEVAQKEAVFNQMNKEYIEQQERKENERLSAEAASKDREDDEAAQVETRARYLRSERAGKWKRSDGGLDGGEGEFDEPTTEEALLAAVTNRKISRKINYDALSKIFDDDGGFSTELLTDRAGPGPESSGTFDGVDPLFDVL